MKESMNQPVQTCPIFVRDKYEVIKALSLFEKLGIEAMTDVEKEEYLLDYKQQVSNAYLVLDGNKFKIRSHSIDKKVGIEELEVQISRILAEYPDFLSAVMEIKEMDNNMNTVLETYKKSRDKKISELPKVEIKTEPMHVGIDGKPCEFAIGWT